MAAMHASQAVVTQLARVLAPHLDTSMWLALRAVNSTMRSVCDETVVTLHATGVWWVQTPHTRRKTAKDKQVVASVRGIVKRGARPLSLELKNLDSAATVLHILRIFSKQTLRNLRNLVLCNVRLTDALGAAVDSAAPQLTSLRYSGDGSSTSVGALRSILSTANCMARLTSLSIHLDTFGYNRHDARALVSALCACSKLEHLMLRTCEGVAGLGVLGRRFTRAAGQLRALRSLELDGMEIVTEEEARAIGGFTQLTSLRVDPRADLGGEPDWLLASRMATAAFQPLVQLVELEMFTDDLQPLAAHLPPQLTSLKILGGIGGPTGPLPAALQRLQLLEFYGVPPRQVLFVQLPTGLTSLALSGINCCPKQGTFEELLAVARLAKRLHNKQEPLALEHGWRMHEEPGYYRRLFGELQWPRGEGLTRLELSCCTLEIEDAIELVERLPDLEELTLACKVHPAAVAAMGGLPRLRKLTVVLVPEPKVHEADVVQAMGLDVNAWSASSVVVTCVTPLLLLSAPRVQLVKFELYQAAAHKKLGRALQEGVVLVQSLLRKTGRDPHCIELMWRT